LTGIFSGLDEGTENCKTFMRRFDPDLRLQISSNLDHGRKTSAAFKLPLRAYSCR